MNNTTQHKKYAVKLFASFDRNIFIPLVAPNNTPEIIHQRLKAMGARIGKDSVEALISGDVDMVKDFQVVSVQASPTGYAHETNADVPDPETKATTIPTVSKETTTEVLIDPKPQFRTSIHRRPGKARGLGYLPTMTLVPVRRGTVYAKLMEMLSTEGGATIDEMVAATGNATKGGVLNLLGRQVREKGYGISYTPSTEKYHIVFPKGISEIIYVS